MIILRLKTLSSLGLTYPQQIIYPSENRINDSNLAIDLVHSGCMFLICLFSFDLRHFTLFVNHLLRYCKKSFVSLLLIQIRALDMTKKDMQETIHAPAECRRVTLLDGSLSPVLSPLFKSIPDGFIGALSYEQIVILNGAAGKLVRVDRSTEFDLLSHISPHITPDLFEALNPWILVNAYQLRHKHLLLLVLRILLVIKIKGRATMDQVRTAINVNSLFVTFGAMTLAGVIDKTPKKIKINNKLFIGYQLTAKGHKLVTLALNALERREALLFQNLSK